MPRVTLTLGASHHVSANRAHALARFGRRCGHEYQKWQQGAESIVDAFLWGLVATSSLVLGGLVGCFFPLGKRTIGLIMAFGAGVLISAVSYELVFEAVSLGKGTGGPTLGIFGGALVFFFADR